MNLTEVFMEKKTMGAFIAALRKANGMTQQELADKLNISNKAVSRWERDECAPDISLIPALAEILGVTCDELLKGERILGDSVHEKSGPKVEKQLKALVNRAISNFKTLMWISLALSAVGLIFMLAITYGFYRPVIGFAVMGLFSVSAFVVAVIGTNKLKEKKNENELFESADEELINRYNGTLGNYSYYAFFAVLSVFAVIIILAIFLPLLLRMAGYVNGVLTIAGFFKFFGGIIPALVIVFFALKDRYCARITGQPYKGKKREKNSRLLLMNSLQMGIAGLSGILFIIAPYFAGYGTWTAEDALLVVAYFLIPVSAVVFAVMLIVCKADRKKAVLPGIRNFLLCIPAVLMQSVHYIVISYPHGPHSEAVKEETWNIDSLLIALSVTLTIFMIFEIIKVFIRRKKEV